MDDLLTDFIAETREMMEAIEGEIIAWEAAASDSSRLDAIFRFVHTVKGNCGFFDLPRLERLSHAAEDALSDVKAGRREPDQQFVSTILATIDCIGEMVSAIEAGEEFPPDRETALLAALDQDDDTALPITTAATAPIAASAAPRSIRLPVDLLDRVMSGVSDMVLARNDLSHRLQQAGTQPNIDGPFERLTAILNDVRNAITRMRMQPVDQLFAPIPRIVRDLSQDLGKQVMIDIEGGDVELDREVIEMIRDPLMHIVRNAVDHGFEGPAERLKAGKREIGLLRIAARRTGNRIAIVISDDGRGLDEEKIAYRALSNHLITQDQRDQMDTNAIHQLIFEPGLSTAEEVSTVSGRGVGMDVVRANLERVGGSIEVNSTSGQGTRLHLYIPLTLSIIAGMIVEIGGQKFALPQSLVEEVEFGSDTSLDHARIGEATLVTMRGQRWPCLNLSDILGLETHLKPADQTFILAKLAKGDQFVLAVDCVHNIGDIVVKPLPPAIARTGCYSGTALLDDGQPILLLDLAQIAVDQGVSDPNAARHIALADGDDTPDAAQEQMAMIFIGFDGQRKAARMDLVSRIETVRSNTIDLSGTHPHAVVDEAILPVCGLDCAPVGASKIRMLRLSDGKKELLYAMREVEDVAALNPAIVTAHEEAFVEGKSLVDGRSVALLDGHALFNAFGSACPEKGGPDKRGPDQKGAICRLPDTDWAKTILAPLVTGGGYNVVYGDARADIAIVIDQGGFDAEQNADAPVIVRLRSTSTPAPGEDGLRDTIYRYDRAAVLDALGKAAAKEPAKRVQK